MTNPFNGNRERGPWSGMGMLFIVLALINTALLIVMLIEVMT